MHMALGRARGGRSRSHLLTMQSATGPGRSAKIRVKRALPCVSACIFIIGREYVHIEPDKKRYVDRCVRCYKYFVYLFFMKKNIFY